MIAEIPSGTMLAAIKVGRPAGREKNMNDNKAMPRLAIYATTCMRVSFFWQS
jgi:hypothetical protein